MTTGGDGHDRLSELSDDLLRRILYFVPSKEAAFTSMLSRRWGSLWRSSRAVNLAVQVHGYDQFRCSESKSAYQEAREAFLSKQDAFVRGAKAALDAAEAPLTRLTFHVETNDENELDGASTISQFLCRSRVWDEVDLVGAVVSHQAASRVEELRIAAITEGYLFYGEESHRSAGIFGLAFLPSKTLRVLDLTRCNLTRSSSASLMAAFPLPRLATLRLRFCTVEIELLQAMVDAAPELTNVQLESLFFVPPPDSKQTTQFHGLYAYQHRSSTTAKSPVLHLNFQSATTLVLALCGMNVQDSGDRRSWTRWDIEIVAPRLQSFKYEGHMRPFILRSAAPGGVAWVDLHFLRRDPDPYRRDSRDNEKETPRVLFWQFVQNFTSARTLKLKVENNLKDIAVTGEARRARLLCAFPRVERLELEGVYAPKSKTAAVAIANLLHCCPVLGEILLKLSATTALGNKGSSYQREFLERKDRSDYNKSIDRFVGRRISNTAISIDNIILGDNKYDDVLAIPGLTGRSFACLQRTLRRVGLQFRLDGNSISSCLGPRLIKFFAGHASVLEEMCIDAGNRRLDEHLTFNVET